MVLTAEQLFRALQRAVETTGAGSWPVVLDTAAARWQGVVGVRVDLQRQRLVLHGGGVPPPPP